MLFKLLIQQKNILYGWILGLSLHVIQKKVSLSIHYDII